MNDKEGHFIVRVGDSIGAKCRCPRNQISADFG